MLSPDIKTDKGCILIADDDENIREILTCILQQDGYTVFAASNGKEALELLTTSFPNLIFLDLMMPVMNGREFFDKIKSDTRFRDIPIVVMSAYDQSEVKLPANEFLRKPFDMKHLRRYAAAYCHQASP